MEDKQKTDFTITFLHGDNDIGDLILDIEEEVAKRVKDKFGSDVVVAFQHWNWSE